MTRKNRDRRRSKQSWAGAIVIALSMTLPGCPTPRETVEQKNEQPPPPAEPIRILVIDDQPLADVIEREWQARSEGEVVVTSRSAQEIAEAKLLRADVVVYPSALMGELVARRFLVPFPPEALDDVHFNRRDIWELPRLRECAWGEETYAVPFGSAQFVLCYRKDVFTHLGIQPPRTWTEYLNVAKKLTDSHAADESDAQWSATVEPLASGSAGQILLARAAAYARHRSKYSALFDMRTMKPLIDGPPFVRALQELADAAQYGRAQPQTATIDEARQQLLDGHCAMAICWPVAKLRRAADESFPIGFAALPGSPDVYNAGEGWEKRSSDEAWVVPLAAVDGRLGSVTREASSRLSAANVLTWLTGTELSPVISPASTATTMFRQTHANNPLVWMASEFGAESARQYADLCQQLQSSSSVLFVPRIPGHARYMAALDEAVEQVALKKTSPAEALKSAGETWQTITEELDVTAQEAAYRQSLGLKTYHSTE